MSRKKGSLRPEWAWFPQQKSVKKDTVELKPWKCLFCDDRRARKCNAALHMKNAHQLLWRPQLGETLTPSASNGHFLSFKLKAEVGKAQKRKKEKKRKAIKTLQSQRDDARSSKRMQIPKSE